MASTAVHMPDVARHNFNSMKPDMEQLAKFESKVHRLVDKQEAKEMALEVEPIINVMGSTAGAGSGCVPYARPTLSQSGSPHQSQLP